jgi:hypothetical protein
VSDHKTVFHELQTLLEGLKPGFYGVIEVGVQNGRADQVRITETFNSARLLLNHLIG